MDNDFGLWALTGGGTCLATFGRHTNAPMLPKYILGVTNGSYNSKYGIVIPQKCVVRYLCQLQNPLSAPQEENEFTLTTVATARAVANSTVTYIIAPSSKHASSIELACLEDGAITFVTVESE